MASNNKIHNYLLHLILLLVWILNGGSVLAVIARNGILISFFLLMLLLFVTNKKKIRKGVINCSFFCVIIAFAFVIINYIFSIKPQDITKYIYMATEFITQGLFCIYIFTVFTYEQFIALFYRVLNFIRWHALISAILISALPFLFFLKVGNEFNGYEADSFLYIFYKVSDQYSFSLAGISIIRNQGLFWEPGVLQFYLNLFLFFQLYVFKTKKSDIALTTIALLSTYSTSAYLIMLIVYSGYLFKKVNKTPVVIIPILLAFVFLIPLFQANLENKLEGEHQTSAAVRFYDLIQQIFVIKNNLLTGVGIDDQAYATIRTKYGLPESMQKLLGYNDLVRGSTNSVLFLLATMGIFMGGLFLYAYAKQNLINENKFLLTIFMFMSVMVEPLLLKPFFITFIVSGLMVIGSKIKYIGNSQLWKPENIVDDINYEENSYSDVLLMK